MPHSIVAKLRLAVSGAVAAAMLAGAVAETAAAPLPVAPGQGAVSASSTLAIPTDVRFVRRRHARRFRGGDAVALAVIGAGVAAVIAGSQHRRRRYYDDTYYDQGYDEGYDPGYYQPRRYYAPPPVVYAPPQVYYPTPEYRVRHRRWRDDGDFDRGEGRHFEHPQPPVVYNRPPPQPEFLQPRRHFDRPAVVHQQERGVQQQENVGRSQYGAPSFCPPGQICDVHR
jgi:hypothetical protein